jgi:dihydroorotase
VSTADELELFETGNGKKKIESITAEATVGHLFFSSQDYARLGSRIKVNPAIKSPVDQFMLRQALCDGRVTTIATDHAPHLLKDKEGGCKRAASGMPMVQFSLPAMLELSDAGVLTIERVVELMCHNPALLFEVRRRGFIRKGYKADVVIVRPGSPWTVTPQVIESKCGWSPLEGHTFNWHVEQTICNGHTVYANGIVDRTYTGQPLAFR